LYDVTVIVTYRIDHEAKRRIHDSARFFGIEILHQLHRPLDVGEKRRGLALALERCRDVRLLRRDTNFGDGWFCVSRLC
jgi:hypothetical protein